METALGKASRENMKVASVFSEALGHLPSRLFVHVMNDDQRACARTLFGSLKDGDKATITVASISKATWGA